MLISSLDFIDFLAGVYALVLLVVFWKQSYKKEIRFLLIGLVALKLFHSFSNVLEWSGITRSLDSYEDYFEMLIPFFWGFTIYFFLQSFADQDIREREEQKELVLKNIPSGFALIELILDPKGIPVDYRFISTNPSFKKFAGCQDLDGKTSREIWPQQEAMWLSKFSKISSSTERVNFEYYHPELEAWWHVMTYRVKEREVAVFITDITQRKLTEQFIRESEIKYRTLIDAANDAILLADYETGIILDANRKASELMGLPRIRIIGRHQSEIHPKGASEYYSQLFREHADQGGESYLVSLVEHTDGHKIPVQISSNVIELKGRKIVMGIFRDISDLKDIEENLRSDRVSLEKVVEKRTEELARANKALEDARRLSDVGVLAAAVAHELRNPLGVIRTALYNLKRKNDNPDLNKHIVNIEKKIFEGDQIIRNLLSYSHIKLPEFGDVCITDILSDCSEHLKTKYPVEDIMFDIQIKEDGVNTIKADAVQMTQLFTNIFDNAYQALEGSQGKIAVDVDFMSAKGKCVVVCCDNGVGIEAEDLKRVFDPFFTRKSKGTGLGLSVCNRIVNLHNGKINIESEKGVGTKVTIVLPF